MSGKWLILICLIFTCLCNCVSTKKETKTGLGSNPKDWSEYQGKTLFEEAKIKCSSLGMRLPTIKELETAYLAKITKTWEKNGFLYLSSDEYTTESTFAFSIGEYKIYSMEKDNFKKLGCSVRCIRETSR